MHKNQVLGIVQRQSFYSSLVSYVGYGIGAINALFLYTQYLEIEQKGLIDFIQVIVLTYISIGNIGVFEAVNKYLPYFRAYEKPKSNDLIAKTLIYGGLALIVTLVVSYLFKGPLLGMFEKSPLVPKYAHLLPIFIIGYFVYNLALSFNVGYQNIVSATSVREIYVRLYNTMLIMLYILKVINFDTLIFLLSFQFWTAAFILLYLLYKKKVLYFTLKDSKVFTRMKGKMFNYLSFFWLASLFNALNSVVDKLTLSNLKGMEEVAFFTVAEYLITILLVPQKSITTSMTPIISNSWRINDKLNLKSMYVKGANNMTWAGGLIYIILLINLNDIFSLFPERYSVGKNVFIVLGLARMIDFITSVNSQIMMYSKRYFKVELFFGMLLTSMLIPVTYYLVSIMGILGSALAQLICFALANFARLFYLKWKEGFSPFEGNIRLFVFTIAGIGIAIYFHFYLSNPLETNLIFKILIMGIKSVTVGLIALGLMYYFKLSNEVNDIIDKQLLSRLNK